jgi:uncharacterized protein YehS (DUF1456 family)
MTDKEIIEMAIQGHASTRDAIAWAIKKEREECAQACEDSVPTYLKNGDRWLKGQNGKPDTRMKDIAPNLEAEWEMNQILKNGSVIMPITEAHLLAEKIRARSKE